MALEIARIVGSGQFATVAVVRDTATGELMAAKVLKLQHLVNPKVIARLRDEARLLQALDHPGIVQLKRLAYFGERPVLLMQWVRGVSFRELIEVRDGGLPAAEALEMIRQAAAALHAAHNTRVEGGELGVIHRDINPSNLLLSLEGEVKVIDFGIAHGEFEDKEADTMSMVLGAHHFLSPERRDGAEDEPEGDVYALGHVLYELLSGVPLRVSVNRALHERTLRGLDGELWLDTVSKGARADLIELIQRMLAYDVRARPSYGALVGAVDAIVAKHGISSDLRTLAEETVGPLVEARALDDPRRHPAYARLQFLEARTGDTPAPSPPRSADTHLRAFFAEPGWHARGAELKRLLARDPSWTVEPLLELLDTAVPRWWQIWRPEVLSTDQVRVVLSVLESRPGPEVGVRARRLARHPDDEIAVRAARLVQKCEEAGGT